MNTLLDDLNLKNQLSSHLVVCAKPQPYLTNNIELRPCTIIHPLRPEIAMRFKPVCWYWNIFAPHFKIISWQQINWKIWRLALAPWGGIFDYDRKSLEVKDEELITQQADFWNNPKQAEVILKNIRTKKVWTDAFDNVTKLMDDLEVLREFHEAGDVGEEELDLE